MRLLRERPHISFGIHLALIRESPEYGWGPAAAKADVPSLLDPEDHAFLTSQEALEILDRVGITVIDYRLLQQAWNT